MEKRIIAFGETPYEAKEYTDEGKGMVICHKNEIVISIPIGAKYISIGLTNKATKEPTPS